jgi:EmrB/QacA subfamily drug resistance transporter
MARDPICAGRVTARGYHAAMTPHGRWILAATILGSSMAMIDGTVVNIALPALQQHMDATIADVQWVVEAYTLFLGALMLTGGALGDRYGRKRVFCIGAVLFSAASLACGLAPTMSALIAARALQGIGAAMLVPGSLAIISACFPDPERGKAIGTWSAFTSMTMSVGPLVGGALIDYVSWRAIFFINIPIAAIVLWLSWRHVPESRAKEQRKLDVPGAVLATLGLGALVYGLVESSRLGFGDARIAAALFAGVALLAAFVIVEWKSRVPMLPLSLFRSRAFSGANALTAFLYGALAGGLFFVPMNLIQLQGFSATGAGAAMLPSVLILFALSRWSGGLVDRIGARLPLIAGPTIAAAGFALFMLPGVDASYWTTFFPATVVLGFGMALTVAPLTTTVMSSVDRSRSGVASGVNNAVAETAGVLAVAILGLAMAQVFAANLDDKLQAARVPAGIRDDVLAQRTKLAAIEMPERAAAPQRDAAKEAVAESFIAGFRCVMLIAATLALLSAITAAISIVRKVGGARKR